MTTPQLAYWLGLIAAMGTALMVGVPGLPKPTIPHPWDQHILLVTTLAAGGFAYLITPRQKDQ